MSAAVEHTNVSSQPSGSLPPAAPWSHAPQASPADIEKDNRDISQATNIDQDEDVYKITYPEGGMQAWLVTFGAFSAMFAGLGLINTIGTLNAYVSSNQLKDYSESSISWIFGLYVFLVFFGGLQIGPIFDAKGPRVLIFIGSVMTVASVMILSVCTEYWHFILDLSILGGLGTSLLFTPAISAISHYFAKYRGLYTGLAASGGGFGGVVFPLMLQSLFPKIGWAWSIRALGFVVLFLCIIGNVLIRGRTLPKRPGSRATSLLPDFRIFLDGTGALAIITAGVFFFEWGLFIPVAYLPTYCLANGVSHDFAYQILAIFSAASVFGRILPGLFADLIGRFNAMLLTLLMCTVSALALWLPAHGSLPLIIIFAILFGFGSGSNISLTPVCVGQLCSTQEYGRYYATVYFIVSFSTLTGIPIGGALIGAAGGEYWGVIVFTGLSYVASTLCFMTVRVMKVGWNLKAVW